MSHSQKQPKYHKKPLKIEARKQVIAAYHDITGLQSIPPDKGYWTLCNEQPDIGGAEIVQLVECGLIQKNQFYGIDYDFYNKGIIEANREAHPEAHWFRGEWLDVIEENYEQFNPALVYFDSTHTVTSLSCRVEFAHTMNLCPAGTVVAANFMLSDGHSSRRFDPNILLEELLPHLRSPKDWNAWDRYYAYRASYTDMGTYIFWRKS